MVTEVTLPSRDVQPVGAPVNFSDARRAADPRADCILAIDIGGTKVEAGLVGVDGTLLSRYRRPSPASDRAGMWAAVFEVADAALADLPSGAVGPSVIGVGCGGPMTHGGRLVSPLNITGWREEPLAHRLTERYGVPACVDNDAKALALAEGWRGAAVGAANYLAIVVSTGVGGGIVLNGRLLEGADGNAGHIGHLVVEPEGRICGCGSQGCLEAEASGTAIAEITGHPAVEADTEMRRRCGLLVGRAAASVASLLDLRLVCVAGSVALGYGADFFDAAQAEADQRARISFARGVRIVPAGCGDEGPLVGAAAVGLAGLDVGGLELGGTGYPLVT